MPRTILALGIFLASGCFGQTEPIPPAFEVASVKVSNAPPGSDASKSTPGNLSMRNMTLRASIAMAYDVKEMQVVGGPKWLDSERYDIDAKSASPAPGPQLRAMLQTLLAERFKVELHRETRIFPGYTLVIAKSGLKVHSAEPGISNISTHNSSMNAEKATMAALAKNLARRLAAPVEDATGLTAAFDFKLELPPQLDRGAAAADPLGTEAPDPASSAAALSHALEDQLGLKLEMRRIPQEVLVIDRAEKLVEN
jgi:uncharacterized protein (TIGR03435 family)